MSRELHSIEDQAALAVPDAQRVIWRVPSASIVDHWWRFNSATGFCECIGYQMAKSRGHLCRHGRSVEIRIAADTAAKQAGSPTIREFLRAACAAMEQDDQPEGPSNVVRTLAAAAYREDWHVWVIQGEKAQQHRPNTVTGTCLRCEPDCIHLQAARLAEKLADEWTGPCAACVQPDWFATASRQDLQPWGTARLCAAHGRIVDEWRRADGAVPIGSLEGWEAETERLREECAEKVKGIREAALMFAAATEAA